MKLFIFWNSWSGKTTLWKKLSKDEVMKSYLKSNDENTRRCLSFRLVFKKVTMIKNKKEIIFFDADGTLWYPKSTKYKEMPHWIYLKSQNANDHYVHLMMIPTVLSTLKKLKKLGIITILLSTHPHPPKEADFIINHKVTHFRLNDLFDEIHATREYHESKGEFIVKILKERNIPKTKALMIGDHYKWDYKPAKDVGVDALLMESEYMKNDIHGKRIKKTLKKLSDLFNYI